MKRKVCCLKKRCFIIILIGLSHFGQHLQLDPISFSQSVYQSGPSFLWPIKYSTGLINSKFERFFFNIHFKNYIKILRYLIKILNYNSSRFTCSFTLLLLSPCRPSHFSTLLFHRLTWF